MIWNSKQKETAASDTQSWRTPVQLVPSFHSLSPYHSSNSCVSFSVANFKHKFFKKCFSSFTGRKRQVGQDSVWVQDTENTQTSYCGYCPRGHWWPRSGVRHRHRASVLLVKWSAGMCQGEPWDYWTDSWHVQPPCTYQYWGLHSGPVARYLLCLWPSSRHRSKVEQMFEFYTNLLNRNHSSEWWMCGASFWG